VGWWLDRFSEGVDLNCYLVRECLAFSRLAGLVGYTDLANEYAQKSQDLAARIRSLLWDDKDGFFYDRNARMGEPLMSRHAGWASSMNGVPVDLIRVKGVSAFTALWAGVATPEQARSMVYNYLFDPKHFWSPFPLATLARSERWYSRDWLPADLGCNWRATIWMPTNYMVYHGLKRYGFHDLASLLAYRTFQLVKQSGDREWYDAETGEGCGLNPFWGWSLLGHFLEYEDENNLDPTSLEDI
jgi:neutral trehalase